MNRNEIEEAGRRYASYVTEIADALGLMVRVSADTVISSIASGQAIVDAMRFGD